MTQAATVTPYTLEQLGALCKQKAPEKFSLFSAADEVLSDPQQSPKTRKEKLEAFLSYEVIVEEEGKEEVYRWQGQRGAYRLAVPKSEWAEPEADDDDGQEETLEEPQDDTPPAPVQEATPALEPPPEPVREPSPTGIFTALAQLIGSGTLLMTLSRNGDGADAPLIVNVLPKAGEGDEETLLQPLTLEAPPAVLDAHFLEAVQAKVEGVRNIRQAIEELKAADKELADAKSEEAKAKKATAGKKREATKKKEAKAKEDEADKKQEEAADAKGMKPLF